jgi:hypothetical protein
VATVDPQSRQQLHSPNRVNRDVTLGSALRKVAFPGREPNIGDATKDADATNIDHKKLADLTSRQPLPVVRHRPASRTR